MHAPLIVQQLIAAASCATETRTRCRSGSAREGRAIPCRRRRTKMCCDPSGGIITIACLPQIRDSQIVDQCVISRNLTLLQQCAGPRHSSRPRSSPAPDSAPLRLRPTINAEVDSWRSRDLRNIHSASVTASNLARAAVAIGISPSTRSAARPRGSKTSSDWRCSIARPFRGPPDAGGRAVIQHVRLPARRTGGP